MEGCQLNAKVPGLERFPAAQEWLDRTTPVAQASDQTDITAANVKLFQAFLAWQKNRTVALQSQPANPKLFQQFLQWQKTQNH